MNDAADENGPAQIEGREQGKAAAELPGGHRVVVVAVVCEGALALLALTLGWLCDVPVWSLMKFDADALLWGVAGTVPPVAAMLLIDRYPVGPLRELKRFMEEQITPIFRGCRLWQLLAIAAMAGLGEELLCRGFLQNGLQIWLSDSLGPAAAMGAALVVASVVFGLAHALTRTYVVVCIAIGFYLGGIWLASENLLVPVIIHGLYDFVALVYMTRGENDPATGVVD